MCPICVAALGCGSRRSLGARKCDRICFAAISFTVSGFAFAQKRRKACRLRKRNFDPMKPLKRYSALLCLLASTALAAQQPASAPHPTTAAEAPNSDTSYIDAQGTAHVTRVVPVPAEIG